MLPWANSSEMGMANDRGGSIEAALYYPKSAGYGSGRERIERSL
jgi:hypothetical protein